MRKGVPAVHLYFHSPCFDGLVSAVLLHDYLSSRGKDPVKLHPVNYHLNETWATTRLEQPAAIVDFLYHPDAAIWFDHHGTTFLTPSFEAHYRQRSDPHVVYDPTCTSCALLIWNTALPLSGDHEAKVRAADLIDYARYESPRQAVYGDAPAFRINASLAIGETDEYSKFLVRQLLTSDLGTVAGLPEVAERHAVFSERRDRGMKAFEPSPDLERRDGFVLADGVLLFAVDVAPDAIVSRYAPYIVAPTAEYSVGVVRTGELAKITAMRNPWKDAGPVNVGEIMQTFGGGGHPRVGSTRLHGKTREQVVETLLEVTRALQSAVNRRIRRVTA